MQRFFVSGYPKSGTTFLQMLLDAHPNINCPGEQSLAHLVRGLTRLGRGYRATLEEMDGKTGGQGVRFDNRGFVAATLRAAIAHLMEQGADATTTHVGLNDNTMARNGETVARLMPRARFVFIVRDPREVAVSLWHHKMRTEPAFVRAGTTMGETCAFVGRTWPAQMGRLDQMRQHWPRRCHVVRYEDLRESARDRHLGALLAFLDVPADADVLRSMWQATDFAVLRERERQLHGERAGFFRAGRTESWRSELKAADVAVLLAGAGPAMTRLGYGPTT